ncbi:UvrD-helicase domain-containing protein [Gracilibacillus kekensis]|uniref:UvrD/REP helicase N-terminal domain-containing protein n=1 Tax=Gracilibacillus kekensis TaxID=1027249 RepID=A0A1M7Q220_9BACI|nr:UvrD-helicase domain-containing protein [Gracilibacillus kekensis]SHN24195.1 UvrD/REP helicase N-terminal domain-containing protein [Gracilibacillus kekensis]
MSTSNSINELSRKLLPPNCDFFAQQKAAIEVEGSIDIVAGPGSGKTTVLIAKCGLLLEEIKQKNKGICLITHTNVAVNEINDGLLKLGFSDIDYPNFVGTIQEFFNNFFAKKAFHIILGDKQFRVLDDEEYQLRFEKEFEFYNPSWPYPNKPNYNKDPRLVIKDNLSYHVTSNAKPNYRESLNKSIMSLFRKGLINNLQCLELSQWYISNYGNQLKRALIERFDFVLLDEAQDTSQLQFEMLNYLFNEEGISFQKFGDPYQALYNIFEGNKDAWVPNKSDVNYREISETSRFGPSIANVVKNVCVEKYSSFVSLDIIKSFQPVYITYNDESDLLTKYRKLIEHFNQQSDVFSFRSHKKDAILSPFHADLSNLFTVYTKISNKNRSLESPLGNILNFCLDILSRETGSSIFDLKREMSSKLSLKVLLSHIVKEFAKGDFEYTKVLILFEQALMMLTGEKDTSFEIVQIKDQLDYFRQKFLSSNGLQDKEQDGNNDFYIGTVHSAKGETHRSTMLVLDTNFGEYHMFDLLYEYLCGNHRETKFIIDENEKNQTIMALKLAYVALSRPTHLMVIAIPQQKISAGEGIEERLGANGWVNVDELFYSCENV